MSDQNGEARGPWAPQATDYVSFMGMYHDAAFALAKQSANPAGLALGASISTGGFFGMGVVVGAIESGEKYGPNGVAYGALKGVATGALGIGVAIIADAVSEIAITGLLIGGVLSYVSDRVIDSYFQTILSDHRVYLQNNPYPVYGEISHQSPLDLATGHTTSGIVGYSGYYGPNTGYNTPREQQGSQFGSQAQSSSDLPAPSWLDPGAYNSIPMRDSADILDLYGPPIPSSAAAFGGSADNGAAAEGPGYGMASPVMPYTPSLQGGTGTASVGGPTASGTLDNNLGLQIPDYNPVVSGFTPAPQGEYNFQPQTGGVAPYEYGGYGGGDSFFMGAEWGSSEPIILDLDGNGVRVDTLQTSRTYFDMSGNGGRNRTAWAAGGDGVLAIDANGDGKINQRSEVVFTDWTQMAGNDMQAVKMVFDSNNDGQLTSADARWNDFKVVKGGAVYSLAQLGITQIGLNGDTVTADSPQTAKQQEVTERQKLPKIKAA